MIGCICNWKHCYHDCFQKFLDFDHVCFNNTMISVYLHQGSYGSDGKTFLQSSESLGMPRWEYNQPFFTCPKIWAHHLKNPTNHKCASVDFKQSRWIDYQGQCTLQLPPNDVKLRTMHLILVYLAMRKPHLSSAMLWRQVLTLYARACSHPHDFMSRITSQVISHLL